MKEILLCLVFLLPCLHGFRTLMPDLPVVGIVPYPDVFISVLAAIACIRDWWSARSSSPSKWTVILSAALLAVASMFWTLQSEAMRGSVILVYLISPFLISSGLYSDAYVFKYLLVFIYGNVVHAILVIVMSIQAGASRLGHIYVEGGGSNPNQFGFEMVISLLVAATALSPFVNCFRLSSSLKMIVRMSVAGACTLFLTSAVLSASRGALLALAAGVVTHWGVSRLSVFRAIVAVWVVACFMVVSCSGIFLGDTVLARIGDRQELSNFGDRTQIWEAGWLAFQETWLLGRGIGGVDFALASYVDSSYIEAAVRADRIPRVFSHNGFIEWSIGTGIVGVIVGSIAIVQLYLRSLACDLACGTSYCSAIFSATLVFSLSGVPYRDVVFIPVAAFVIGALNRKKLKTDSPETQLQKFNKSLLLKARVNNAGGYSARRR